MVKRYERLVFSIPRKASLDQERSAEVFQQVFSTLVAHLDRTVSRGAGTIVAILDTGVDQAHPTLAGRLVAGFDFVDMDDDPGEVGTYGQDPAYGHGTHVAGIVVLTAPEASLMPVRVLDRHGVGNIWVLAEAPIYPVDPDNNPATPDGANVINISLGTLRPTNLLAEIVAEVTCGHGAQDADEDDEDGRCSDAAGYNVVVVAAAGNRGTAIAEYPAAEQQPGLLAVAASTQGDELADFSSYGAWVSVAAPGANILSSVPGGGYGTWSGTSMAALCWPAGSSFQVILKLKAPLF